VKTTFLPLSDPDLLAKRSRSRARNPEFAELSRVRWSSSSKTEFASYFVSQNRHRRGERNHWPAVGFARAGHRSGGRGDRSAHSFRETAHAITAFAARGPSSRI